MVKIDINVVSPSFPASDSSSPFDDNDNGGGGDDQRVEPLSSSSVGSDANTNSTTGNNNPPASNVSSSTLGPHFDDNAGDQQEEQPPLPPLAGSDTTTDTTTGHSNPPAASNVSSSSVSALDSPFDGQVEEPTPSSPASDNTSNTTTSNKPPPASNTNATGTGTKPPPPPSSGGNKPPPPPGGNKPPPPPPKEDSNLILGLLPFTVRGGRGNPASFSHMAAGLMALDHFHEANPIVVPELANITSPPMNCTQQLDMRFVDTGADSTKVAEFLMQQVAFKWPLKPMALVGVPSNDAALTAGEYAVGLKLPLVSSGADSTSLTNGRFFNGLGVSTNVNLNVMGALIMDYIIKRQGRRQVLATLATTHEFGADLRSAIETNAKQAMCPSGDDNTGEEEEEPCFVLHQSFGLSPPFGGYVPNKGAGWAFQQIQAAGIRNIVLILNAAHAQLAPIANDAMALGMLSPERRGDYVWILAAERGQRLTELTELATMNHNVSLLLEGMATVVPLDGFDYDPIEDPFLHAWKKQNETMVERLNQLFPIQKGKKNTTTPGYYQAPNDYFQTQQPYPGAGFFYDAVMTVAMGKCALDKAKKEKLPPPPPKGGGGGKGGPPPPPGGGGPGSGPPPGGPGGGPPPDGPPPEQGGQGDRPPPLPGNDNTRRHLKRKRGLKGVQRQQQQQQQQEPLPNNSRRQLQPSKKKKKSGPKNKFAEAIEKFVEFHGATGPIKYGENSKSPGARPRDLVTYGVHNFRRSIPPDDDDESLSLSSEQPPLHVFLTDIHRGSFEKAGGWTTAPDGPFIYANGLPTPPVLNRDLPEQNYLSPAIQATGLAFLSIALLTAFASAILIAFRRNSLPVRQAQPPFLLLLILGATLMSFAILTLGFDESFGFTDTMLDAACTSTPFLLCLGYNIIYLALFSKLYRINSVMQFRRVKVTITKVVGPFVLNMLLTVGILIVWAVIDPYVWVRSITDPITMESYGKCQSDNALPFLIPLLSLIGLSTISCAYMAYKCRDIDERFSDSNYIFYTIFVQIQVLLVGIPILLILDNSSADASYLGKALLIFVIVMTTLLLMIAPKAYTIYEMTRASTAPKRKVSGGVTHVSGLNLGPSTMSAMSGVSKASDVDLSAVSGFSGRRRSTKKSNSEIFAETKREVEAMVACQSEVTNYDDERSRADSVKEGYPKVEEQAESGEDTVRGRRFGVFHPDQEKGHPKDQEDAEAAENAQ